jgi:hypothetical protein
MWHFTFRPRRYGLRAMPLFCPSQSYGSTLPGNGRSSLAKQLGQSAQSPTTGTGRVLTLPTPNEL